MKWLISILTVCVGVAATAFIAFRLFWQPPVASELVSLIPQKQELFDQLGQIIETSGDLERSGLTVFVQPDPATGNTTYAREEPERREGDVRRMLSKLGAAELAIWPGRIAMIYFYRTPRTVEGIAYWPARFRVLEPKLLVHSLRDIGTKPGIYIQVIDDKWGAFIYRPD
jgi:hypothetical protein